MCVCVCVCCVMLVMIKLFLSLRDRVEGQAQEVVLYSLLRRLLGSGKFWMILWLNTNDLDLRTPMTLSV